MDGPICLHRLLDDYFIREEECGGAVVKLHQVHAPVQIIYLTQYAWLFIESAAAFVVAHWSLQLAMPSNKDFCV
jgi:cytochrome c oxidase subunit IV